MKKRFVIQLIAACTLLTGAMGSLGLRLLGPFVGGVIGAGADVRASEHTADSHGKWAVLGVGLGGLVVSAIDGAILGWEIKASSPPRTQALLALPDLVLLRNGMALGYSGQF